jgi:hypothetical protein
MAPRASSTPARAGRAGRAAGPVPAALVVTGVVVLAGMGAGRRVAGFSVSVTALALGAVVALWWMSGLRYGRDRGLPLAVVLAGGTAAAALLSANASNVDLAFSISLGLIVIAVWAGGEARRTWSSERLGWAIVVACAGASLITIGLWLVARGGFEAASRLDTALSAWFPRGNPGEVFHQGEVFRSRGPYGHPNETGAVIAVFVAALVPLLVRGTSPALRRAAFGSVGLGLVAVVLSGTRVGAVACALGIVVLWVFGISRPVDGGQRWWRIVPLAVLLFVAVGAADTSRYESGDFSYGARIATVTAPTEDSGWADRWRTWNDAWQVAVDEMPFGVGYEALLERIPAVHNTWLFLAASVGVVVAAGFAALAAVAAWRAVRTLTVSAEPIVRGVSSALLVWLVLSMTEDRPNSVTTMALFGAAAGYVLATGRPPADPDADASGTSSRASSAGTLDTAQVREDPRSPAAPRMRPIERR